MKDLCIFSTEHDTDTEFSSIKARAFRQKDPKDCIVDVVNNCLPPMTNFLISGLTFALTSSYLVELRPSLLSLDIEDLFVC